MVFVPPSSLTIWPRPTEALIANSTFKTTCSVSIPVEQPNQNVSLTWIRNNHPLNMDNGFAKQSLKRMGNILVSELELFIKPDDNFALFRCEARSSLIEQPLFEQFQLIVHFPPMSYFDKDKKDKHSIPLANADWAVANGVPYKVKCSYLSNPGSKITWFSNTEPVCSILIVQFPFLSFFCVIQLIGLPMTHSETPTNNGLGIVTSSVVDLTFNPDGTDVNLLSHLTPTSVEGIAEIAITCASENAVGSNRTSSLIQVVLPPKRLRVSNQKKVIPHSRRDLVRVHSGQILNLLCEIDRENWLHEGNKLPNWSDIVMKSFSFKWFHNDEEDKMLADGPSLSLVTSPNWNGKQITCEASSELVFPPHPSKNHRQRLRRRFTLDILYGPGKPVVTLGRDIEMPVREGTEITATCMPTTGNPQPTARWVVAPLQPSVMGPTFRTERAIGGGSTLRLTASAFLDGATITCETYNQLGKNSSDLTVSTEYRPVFTDCTTDLTVLLFGQLPEFAKVICKAKSVPFFQPQDIYLSIDNDDVTHMILVDEKSLQQFRNDGMINIPRNLLEAKLPVFSKNQAGTRKMDESESEMLALTVTVSNELGKASRTVFITFSTATDPEILADSRSAKIHRPSSTFPAALSILVAVLTAVGVILIAANALFISLYLARRSIMRKSRRRPSSDPQSSHDKDSQNGSHILSSNGKMCEILLSEDGDGHETKRMVTLEDVAGMVLQRSKIQSVSKSSAPAITRASPNHRNRMLVNLREMKIRNEDFMEGHDLLMTSEILDDEGSSDSGRGDSNRGMMMLEPIEDDVILHKQRTASIMPSREPQNKYFTVLPSPAPSLEPGQSNRVPPSLSTFSTTERSSRTTTSVNCDNIVDNSMQRNLPSVPTKVSLQYIDM